MSSAKLVTINATELCDAFEFVSAGPIYEHIMNPPSAWAQAVIDQPQVGSQCWHFPQPSGPKGRFINYFPQFWAIWQFSKNKSAAKELIRMAQPARASRANLRGGGTVTMFRHF